MANQAQLDVLKQGSIAWNTWREQHPSEWLDLRGANLSGANLSDTNLNHADLVNADLVNANLNGADLSRANLSDAFLIEADLSRANLSDAFLIEANLSGADLSDADLSLAHLFGANLSGANLSGANLSDADLVNVDLSGTNLNGTTLSGASFGEVGLSGADLARANLNVADLREARHSGANLSGNMKLGQFMHFIRDTWGLTPKQAMDLLHLKSLSGLHYRDLLRQLQPLVEQQATNAPTSPQTLEEQDNENEQTMAMARLKLDELKEVRGISTAHPARLAVLQNVLNSQIDDQQLQRLIQAVWGATTIRQLNVNQVEALISWAKEDDFVKEVDGVLGLFDGEEP